jgi:hypothetical protein
VQYATIHSEDHILKGPAFAVYSNVRRTRRWLRFFAWIELLVRLRKSRRDYGKGKDLSVKCLKGAAFLEQVFRILFYLFDHQVALAEIGVLEKGQGSGAQRKSLRMYLLQNVCGAAKCLLEMLMLLRRGGLSGAEEELGRGEKLMRSKSIEFLRNILDVFVACYYLN